MMNDIYSNCSDENILTMIREQSNEQAFEALYNRYFKVLFNFAYSKVNDRFSAQEIVQEVFVNLWQQRQCTEVACCRSFLFAIMKRRIISFYRKEYTRQHHHDQWQLHHENHTESADQEILTLDLQNRYEEGLHLLPPKCHEVFTMSRKGFSNKQIGAELLISEKTVEQHITKALRVLREHLKEHMICAILLFPLF